MLVVHMKQYFSKDRQVQFLSNLHQNSTDKLTVQCNQCKAANGIAQVSKIVSENVNANGMDRVEVTTPATGTAWLDADRHT